MINNVYLVHKRVNRNLNNTVQILCILFKLYEFKKQNLYSYLEIFYYKLYLF